MEEEVIFRYVTCVEKRVEKPRTNGFLVTALAMDVMQSAPSVSTLSFELSDLDLHIFCMGQDHSSPGIEGRGQRSKCGRCDFH